eukprot:TRINITY_DN47871_c0_g1_i1.p1 TRINITY_DN47871_c0_g1~~TRINITY_DN47871_c0_g1_i1.p1  ORF type:complete len:128 (-),score=11.14 TRINITY_DN47871_c0_g1_i1:20-403(-)
MDVAVEVIPFIESEEEGKARFQAELEYVQCFANPYFLQYLSGSGLFEEKAFLNYLEYLYEYWSKMPHLKYITYPDSLAFLRMCKNPEFRAKLSNPQDIEFLHSQQFYKWRAERPKNLPPTTEQYKPS